MPFIKTIGLMPGETVTEATDTYLNYKMQGLTGTDTTIEANDHQYPVGYFSDENIDIFKLGITTLINLGYVLDKGGSVDSDDYKKHSDYFINEAFEKFAPISPYHTEDMLCAFADLAKEMKVEMFDREQYHLIREKQQELLKSKEEGRTM